MRIFENYPSFDWLTFFALGFDSRGTRQAVFVTYNQIYLENISDDRNTDKFFFRHIYQLMTA